MIRSIQSWRYGLYVQVWYIGPEIEDMEFGSRWSGAFRAREEEIENETGGRKEKEDEEGKNSSFLAIFVGWKRFFNILNILKLENIFYLYSIFVKFRYKYFFVIF